MKLTMSIELFKERIVKNPDNLRYYVLLSTMYGSIAEHNAVLDIVEMGFERFPSNLELLFR